MTAHRIGLCFVAVLVVCGCSHSKDNTAASDDTSDAVAVKTVTARPVVVHPEVTLAGFISPLHNVTITSALSEPATEVNVDEGDVVAAGQVLAQLDDTDLRASLEAARRSASEADLRVAQQRYQSALAFSSGRQGLRSAQDAVLQAASKLRLDTIMLERYRALAGSGYVPQQQVDTQRSLVVTDAAALRSARASLADARNTVDINGGEHGGLQASTIAAAAASASSAHAQVDQAAAQVAKATIRSPFDGIVINRNLNPGEYPGSRAIFTIQDMSAVFAILSASSSQIFDVHTGDSAQIYGRHSTAPVGAGTVEAVLGQATPGSTNFTVKVRLRNPDHRLVSGMVVSAVLRQPAQTGIGVPSTAFVDDTHERIAVVRDGAIAIVPVRETGSADGTSVVRGLAAGERVVTNGQLGYTNGERVVAQD
ncbi:MAG: efflux RND transporter periplasmic adaptor subunit [Candidatus Eremiobacteraeota bacterium]|nr:efflux RND transporter periplasmic adaptor subunit [Candidatus Eremiobacteraeota bacterium]